MHKTKIYRLIAIILPLVMIVALFVWRFAAAGHIHLPFSTTAFAWNEQQFGPVPGELAITVDGTKRFQRIDGFGTNINGMVWNDGQVVPALDFLATTMNATIFRVIVDEADWEQANDNTDPRTFNWDYYNAVYASPKFASLWNTVRYLEQKNDTQVVLSVMGRVPDWMGRTTITAEAEDEWVEMVSSLVVYGREQQGLSLQLFSPVNEVDMGDPEGPAVDATQYARLMHKLVVRLQDLGLADIQLIVPDIAYTDQVPAYLPPLLADETVMAQVAHVAFHNYGGTIDMVAPLIQESRYPELSFWLTEYSQWCEDCVKRPQPSEQWQLAADTADFLFDYLENGASAALLWDGFDSYYYHHGRFEYWGVMSYNEADGSFVPRHRFYTAAQVFRFVRPGMVRIAADSSISELRVLAFIDPATNALTIVGHNPVDHPETLTINLAGLPSPDLLHFSQTTSTKSLINSPDVAVVKGTFTVQIAANSVFALSTVN